MSNDNVEYFPLDVRALKKGDVIPIKQIEEITGCPRDHRLFSLRILWLRTKITQELHKLGIVYAIRQRQGTLVICEDSEAIKYNENRERAGLRRIKRAHECNLHVDRTKLTELEQRIHERALLRQGTILAAIKKAKKCLALPASKKRQTPILSYRKIS